MDHRQMRVWYRMSESFSGPLLWGKVASVVSSDAP